MKVKKREALLANVSARSSNINSNRNSSYKGVREIIIAQLHLQSLFFPQEYQQVVKAEFHPKLELPLIPLLTPLHATFGM